ncbi:MAG: DNA polymerase I [Clostridia bacterium]|nr:DNA polymerase I [Clostridia bacterium]
MKNLLIIDGNSIINRAFYSIRLLTNKHGLFTNGIYGFLKIMFKSIDEICPDYICVAFDLKAPTFRHKKYAQYKAQRKGMPEELRVQMPVMKEVLKAMNIAILEKEGFEADDIIGTVSRICDETGISCHILTGDRDDLQLASDNTKVHLTITRMGQTTTSVYDWNEVLSEYGVTPTEFIDVKGLMGDTSDNIPGVKGIGEKTAFGYIQKFKSIESLYENLDDEIVKPAARKKLEEGKDMAILSKELCTIDRFVDIGYEISDFEKKPYNDEKLTELFINLEFNAFLKDIVKDSGTQSTPECEFEIIDISQMPSLTSDISKTFVYRLYGENDIEALSFKLKDCIYIIFAKDEQEKVKITESLKPVFEDENILKISENIKKSMLIFKKYGITFDCSYFDISIGAYVINPSKSSYDVASISTEMLEEPIISEKDVTGTGKGQKPLSEVDSDVLRTFVCQEICAIEKLVNFEKEKIKADGQEMLLYEIEMPLVAVLANMEIEGFTVDREMLESFTGKLAERLKVLENEIYELAGEEFNINSTKQLGVILFEKLGLKVIKKTKTGYSTDASVLEKLNGSHPIIEKILTYRGDAKLKSTYGDGLLAVINPDTHKIHSSFNQTVTTTGRISSTEPNLQNIPMRREEGREIRKMFIAKDSDHILIDADYSQIELRILAHMANDETMIEAFRSGEDIHTSTASRVFGVSKDEVTPLLRTRAKAVNFGIVYGMGDYSLSQDLGISVKEAKAYIQNYFEKYASIKNYLDSTVENAKENGYVTTLFGRRRYIPEISSSNFMTRSFGERVAMNTPIQGTAADIIKIAMVKVFKALKEKNLKSRLILQVHDELIIEAEKSEAKEVEELLKECMMSAAELKTTLISETGVGDSWYDAH